MRNIDTGITRRRFLSTVSMALAYPCINRSLLPFFSARNVFAAEGPDDVAKDARKHDTWLKLTVEEALEPKMFICDPHHHLNPEYLPKDFLSDISGGHNIVKTVFIESVRNKGLGPIKMTPLEETQFIVSKCTGIESRTEVAAGIVSYADLMVGNAAVPLLEAHMEAGKGRFRGIRLARGSVTSDDKFREGYANLRRFNLSLDVYVPHSNLKELANLAKAFPDTPVIVNHIGNVAGIGAEDENSGELIKKWRAEIKGIATCRNVFMKLGGLGMTAFGFGWHNQPVPPGSIELAKKTAPFITYCIEQFGTGRCMFESNWPVDKESFSYTVLWNAFKRMTVDFSESERRDLFYNTATEVYRL